MKNIIRKSVSLAMTLFMLASLAWTSRPALASSQPTVISAVASSTQKITVTFSKAMADPWGLKDGGFS